MTPRRMQLCTFCKKHAIRIGIKNHIRNCPYKTCRCKCCEETRICQRFNRANTKNSRKPVGERTLTLPPELIELLGFEKRILDVVKEIREFSGRNDKQFGEIMFKWIENGFEFINRIQISNPTANNRNDPNAIQKHSNIPSGLSIEPAVTVNGYNQTENCTFITQNGCMDGNFYGILNGYEMKNNGYGAEQQMRSRDSNFEASEMKFTPLYPLHPMTQVPEMIFDVASTSPKSDCFPQQEYFHVLQFNGGLIKSSINNGNHLIELKSLSDNFQVGDINQKKNSSGSPRLPNFYQMFDNK